MPTFPPEVKEKQKNVPMIFRRHGDTAPKTKGHALGMNTTPASVYVHQLEREGKGHVSTLEQDRNAKLLQIAKPFCPNFIENDKKVLRFGAFFLEAVHESNMENYRVRKCEVLYYLEDNTIQITEPKIENSGILQGNFVKRHRIPVPGSDERGHLVYYSFRDLNVGQEVVFYGRSFHLFSTDAFSREFLSSQGISVPEDESIPRDMYTDIRKAHMSRETGQDPNANYGKKQYPMKAFMEARLGKFARPSDFLKNFLEYDRHVLRFFAIWDDTKQLYGMEHIYVLHYFLSDGTIEILEEYERNSGCDPFPKLLNRTKLPRDPTQQASAAVLVGKDQQHEEEMAEQQARAQAGEPKGSSNNSKNKPIEYFTWQDLAVGKHIPIYNRNILLLDADETTRTWYREHNMALEPAIVLQKEAKVVPAFVPPPHNGIGSEEDSLQSCYHLLPKAPMKSVEQLDNKEMLRFRARLVTTKPEDIHRNFIVSITIADQMISVMEPVQRNSGIVGGKFLERQRVKRIKDGEVVTLKHSTATPEYLGLHDFYVGAKVNLLGRIFVIYEMDEHSALYMESNPKTYPKSDKKHVLTKLKAQLASSQAQPLASQLRELPAGTQLDAHQIGALFESNSQPYCEHEWLTLIRAYGNKHAGKIPAETVAELLL